LGCRVDGVRANRPELLLIILVDKLVSSLRMTAHVDAAKDEAALLGILQFRTDVLLKGNTCFHRGLVIGFQW
jgi:hypothetical protein